MSKNLPKIENDYGIEIDRIKRVNLNTEPATVQVEYTGLAGQTVDTPCLITQLKATKTEILARAEIVEGSDGEQGNLNI